MDRGQSQGKRERAEEESIEGASTFSFISPVPIDVYNGQYDVFLSFRGSDTRKAFTDHLYHSLIKAGTVPICVFRDDNSIPIGEEFGSQILDAITRSKISILIISENYASSKWCLRELTHIMDCKKRTSHMALPIFYKVDPSDVRYLKGSFGGAFHSREKRFDEKDIQEGLQALREVSDLHGWESEKFANGHEGELVEKVVENVLSKLRQDFQLDVTKHLVGIGYHVNKIRKWVDTPTSVARMIGIYGMGGIGKTTLAKVIYNQLSNDFVHRSFLADIRETTHRDNMPYLQKQLIKDVLQIEHQVGNVDYGISLIKSRFRQKKVLLLLDDIDDKNQLDALARERDWFVPGSVIIVTTRNEAVLDQSEFEVDYKYKLNELNRECALLLFNRHAFHMDHFPGDFRGISCDIISTMGGLPLALQVVGSYLYKKNRTVWEDVQKQLKNQPNRDVQKILQISYDALEDGQKQIFLDIVCFFIYKTSGYAMYMWEDYGFYPSQGIEELKLRCLIKIGDHGEFLVHDQLRDLGRSIFCQGQPLEKRSGPWDDDYKGVPKVLEINAQGRPAWFSSRSPSFFRKNLWRHLSCFRFRDNLRAAASGTSNDLSEVRWLKWRIVQSDLSPSMHLSNLSILDLYGCEIGEYWQGWRSFMASKRLKVLRLENCHNLRRTPDLSVFTQLKILILWNCEKLKHLHPSIGKLTSLVSLNLLMCKRLKELPEEMDELKDLEELFLCNSSIIKIPMSIGSLRKLKTVCTASYKKDHLWEREIFHLNGTSIFNQPESIFAHHLCRRGNDKLRSVLELPSSLQCLDLRGSNKLQSLPELPSSLQHLLLQGCKELRSLPKLPSSLQSLDLQKCEELRSLPELPSSLWSLPKLPSSCQSLDLRGCRKLQLLPELPSSLQMLDLFFCLELQSLPELPSSLQYLDLRACEELRSLPELPSSLQHLDLGDCKELRSLPKLPSSLQHLDLGECKELQSLPELPSSLQHLKLKGCKKVRSLPKLPSSLQSLDLMGCEELRSLPELPSSLQNLYLLRCKELRSLPELPSSLKSLELPGCNELRSLPELPAGLRYLRVTCPSLGLQQLLSHKVVIHLEKLNFQVLDYPEDIDKLSSMPLKLCFEEWDKLTSLRFDMLMHFKKLSIKKCSSLEFISLKDCNSIERLRCLELPCLKELKAVKCCRLVKIEGLDGVKFLENLDFGNCKSMETLPDLTGCEKLRSLRVQNCKKLTQLQGLEMLNLIHLDISGCDSLEAIPKLFGTCIFRNYEPF